MRMLLLMLHFTKDDNVVVQVSLFVGWLLNVPAICESISGTDLLIQFYVLPH